MLKHRLDRWECVYPREVFQDHDMLHMRFQILPPWSCIGKTSRIVEVYQRRYDMLCIRCSSVLVDVPSSDAQ